MRALTMIITAAAISAVAAPTLIAKSASTGLATAVSSAHRSETNKARDKYRKPAATLKFYGVRANHTVVEIWPGGGWYTEILAPYLNAKGKLIVAPPSRANENTRKFLGGNAGVYGKVDVANFPAALGGAPVAPGTADVVLTFRNVHNWRMGSGHPENADYSEAAFKEIYSMLKPGGVLGIEDHRLPEGQDSERERKSGYIKVSTVRRLAEQAGFKFAGSSEVNANPKDTKDYAKGVWTLPPRLIEGDADKAKYQAIGESDRMTLKFIKPRK